MELYQFCHITWIRVVEVAHDNSFHFRHSNLHVVELFIYVQHSYKYLCSLFFQNVVIPKVILDFNLDENKLIDVDCGSFSYNYALAKVN